MALRRQSGNVAVRQAPELKLKEMHDNLFFDRQLPPVSGGPIYSTTTTVLCCLLMLRGISARSMLKEQLTLDRQEKTVNLELRKRKGVIDAKPHHIVLSCICKWTNICPYCVAENYMEKRAQFGGRYLFINLQQGPVSRTAYSNTFKVWAKYTDGVVPRPHSCRVTGARHWIRLGLSLDTTASIGAWADIKTLKYYVGAAVMTMRVNKELAGSQVPTVELENLVKDLAKKIDKFQEHRSRPSGAGSVLRQQVAMVRVDRRPFRWHHIKCADGPAERWSTECGEIMNLVTMTLKQWQEWPAEEPVCHKCSKKAAKNVM